MSPRLQDLLREAHYSSEAAREREEETRNRCHELSSRMNKAEAMYEEIIEELSQVLNTNLTVRSEQHILTVPIA